MDELTIQGETIKLSELDILLKTDFSDPKELAEWLVIGDISLNIKAGALEIKYQTDGKLDHGQLFSKKKFGGDILMEFSASTILPSNNDIIWWWGVNLNKQRDNWESGYLGALGGWWSNQAGIEKIEGKKVYMAKTPLFKLKPGREYKIECGMLNGTALEN